MSVMKAGLQAEIRTRNFLSMKQDCYPLNYDAHCNVTKDLSPVMLRLDQEVDPKGCKILLIVNLGLQKKMLANTALSHPEKQFVPCIKNPLPSLRRITW